jgi:hypothetical protein
MPVASLRSSKLAIVCGDYNADSNATRLGVDWYVTRTIAYGYKAASGSTLSAAYQSGQARYVAIRDLINEQTALYPSAKIFLVFIHGETEAAAADAGASATAYAANMGNFATALETATGRSDLYYIDHTLSADIDTVQEPWNTQLNTSKATFAATKSGRCTLFAPQADFGGALTLGVFWDTTRKTGAKAAWQTLIASL